MAKRVTKGNLWGYIQSRPYASVADIRRLFLMEVEGAAALPSNEGAYYIGLPRDAADLIRQLWQEGRIMLDLNPDVKARVVQGVYPARFPQGRFGGRGAGGGEAADRRAGRLAGAAGRGGRQLPGGGGGAAPRPRKDVPSGDDVSAAPWSSGTAGGGDVPEEGGRAGDEGPGAGRRRRRKRRGSAGVAQDGQEQGQALAPAGEAGQDGSAGARERRERRWLRPGGASAAPCRCRPASHPPCAWPARDGRSGCVRP